MLLGWLKRRREKAARKDRKSVRWVRLSWDILEERVVPSWVPQQLTATQNGQIVVPPSNDVAGGIQALVAQPANADVLYVGAINGGIWKTTNATAASPTWTPLTDSLPSQSIGSLAFDPTDATNQTLLAGTARLSNLTSTPPTAGDDEVGLYRTTDGGASWAQLNAALLVGHPFNAVSARGATLMAASRQSGLFRSLDTGATWTLVSGSNGLPSGPVYDLVGDPGNSSRFLRRRGFVGGQLGDLSL